MLLYCLKTFKLNFIIALDNLEDPLKADKDEFEKLIDQLIASNSDLKIIGTSRF